MSRIMRLVVLVAGLTSLLGMSSSSAGAVTWDNSGALGFAATAGASTLSATDDMACLKGTMSGAAPDNVTDIVYSMSATAEFDGCMLAGIATSYECGLTFTGITTNGTGDGSVIIGTVDTTCNAYWFGAKVCQVVGGVEATYTNATPGRLALTTSTNLTVVRASAGNNCPLGNLDRGHLSPMTFTMTVGSPTITRTT